jgi:hypothetical protein
MARLGHSKTSRRFSKWNLENVLGQIEADRRHLQ